MTTNLISRFTDNEKLVAATITAAIIETNPGLLLGPATGTVEEKAMDVYYNCLVALDKIRTKQ